VFNLKSKNNKNDTAEDAIRQLDGQYAKMSIEFEELRNLKQKIEKIDTKLREMEEIIARSSPVFQTHSKSATTKEAIKLILQKHGELTSFQLSKLMKLSRTRCNEYLKQMESEGMATSRIYCRKKLYKIRQ
jgi:response regulator of citrate/malate metabolism